MAFEWTNDVPYVDPIRREVKVQVRVVADGVEQVVLQTNVEMMQCSSGVKDAERLWNPVKTRKRRREDLRGGSMHMNVSSQATTATWSSKMLNAPRIPCGGEPRTGRPTGCPTNAGPTARWDAVCVSIWEYVYADITLNLRRVQISPSICVVADDEYDRNHI